jgi:glycerol-3-phosphate dehydrogenase
MTGRYGDDARAMFANAPAEQLALLEGTQFCLAELAWIAGNEWVEHLDDLLLRRTRIGNLLAHGGRDHLPAIRSACQAALGWDDARWNMETDRYLSLWENCYYLPSRRPA